MHTTDIDTLLEQLREALMRDDWNSAVNLVEALRPPDQAELFSELPETLQDELLERLNPEDSADIMEELDDEDAAELAQRLDSEELVRILNKMEPDEAADLLGDIPPAQVDQALSAIEDAAEILPLLEYHDDSAGGLMTSADVILHQDLTAREALDHLRTVAPDAETVYYLFVVDDDVRLVGVVSLRELVLCPPERLIQTVMDQDVITIPVEADQEQAARLMARYDLLAMPVVDDQNHLLGIITHDDLVEVLEVEATEDIYRLGGVTQDQPVDTGVSTTLRSRVPWLVLNLGTAMISAFVLSLFSNTIAQFAILAVFFPIVAGVSGSAGTQTLTVTVRGLALGLVELRDGLRTLTREFLVGLMNGIIIGVIVALIALIWQSNPILGLVVGAATFFNLICAGVAGVLIPLGMSVLRIDPALASPVLVTTITDTFGYFFYLGFATLTLIYLL
jgi:magnesium transporter